MESSRERMRRVQRESGALQEALLQKAAYRRIEEDPGTHLLENFDRLAGERVHLQNTVVRSGMFFFANALREFILREEETWREEGLEARVQDYGLPESPEPILFMSVSTVFANLRKLQADWYERDLTKSVRVLHWLLRRLALLITFPYDEETFDDPQYRQKHSGVYLANMALLHDAFALAGTMWRDATRGVPRGPLRKPFPEDRARRLRAEIMGRVQGDSLSTQFQKMITAASVSVGDPLIFERRRPAAVAPTDMDIITECQGVARARAVHAASDVRLSDVFEQPRYEDLAWLVIMDYYFIQKMAFPWMELCTATRLGEKRNPLPRVEQVPVTNGWAVDGEPCGSLLQAILLWCRLMPDEARVGGRRYAFREVCLDFV